MLCDEIIETSKNLRDEAAEAFGPGDKRVDMFAGIHVMLRGAERFVLSPQTVSVVGELSGSFADGAFVEHLFLPAPIVWLEWSGLTPGNSFGATRHGVLYAADFDDPARGYCAYFSGGKHPEDGRDYYLTISGFFGFRERLMFTYNAISDLDATKTVEEHRIDQLTRDGSLDFRKLGAFIGGAISLINTPRISDLVHEDHARLNRKRAQKGKRLLLSWSEVRLRPGVLPAGVADGVARHGGTAFHHVRAFLRIRRGRWEIVRPHTRGNPELGGRRHRYVVRQPGETGGGWAGGALPDPVPFDPDDGEGA